MSRRSRVAAAVVLAAVMSACAPPPEDDGVTLTLPPTTTTTTSTSATAPPLSVPARITLGTSGPVRTLQTLDKGSVCLADGDGAVSVHGATADGSVLDVTVSNPASGRYPLGVAPAGAPPPPSTAQGARVTRLSLRLQGKEYSRPASGEISIGDARGRWGTVVAQGFAEEPSLKMTADWLCHEPAPAPPPPRR